MLSLKKTGYTAFIGVTALLAAVIVLILRQYQLTESYNTVIVQSEETNFQFSTIREQITTSLIVKDWPKIVDAAAQLKELNSSLLRLQENNVIPGEYRLDLAKQVDLSGLAIAAQDIISSTDKRTDSLNLQHRMRVLAEYLVQFDRVIVGQMRAKVVQFQTIMLGALGAVVCMISFLLLFFYRKTMVPILRLTRQAEDADILATGFSYDSKACTEVAQFTDSVNEILQKSRSGSKIDGQASPRSEQFETLINESINLANGIINYAQLLKDSCKEIGIGKEEATILQNIIDAAERIARLNKEM